MKLHLPCAEQQVSRSNLTKFCACHAERWNLIYNAQSNRCHDPTSPNTAPLIYSARSNRPPPPTSPNTAPATQNSIPKFLRKSLKTVEPSFPMRGTIREWSDHDPTMIREWSDHETVSPQPASQPGLLFELTTSIFYWKMQRFAPNLTFKPSPSAAPATKSGTRTSPSTAPATKSDTWTSPNTAPATKSDTRTSPSTAPATKSDAWTSPNIAPATKSDTRTSPRIAPATQKDSHASSSSHMKRHLQCAEQQASPSNITKYCACHTKFHSQIS